MRRIHLLLLLIPYSFLLAFSKPVTYIWDINELTNLAFEPASKEYKKIVEKADDIIGKPPVAVTDKTSCISGDKHNYESLSIYWWPDPKNPGGPYVARDGEFNPEYRKYDYPRLLQLKDNLVTCSKAFFLTGDSRYYDYFCRQLDTWFINPETRMVPNLEFSQFVPGHNNGRGNPQGMSDAYNFNDMLESIRLVNAVASIGKPRMKAMKAWFKDLAHWMQTSDYGKKTQSFKNGQLLTFDTTLYNIFIFTGQKSQRKAIFKDFPQKRVNTQIAADGKMPEALRRTRAFFYSVHNLQRFVDFMALAGAEGRKLPRKDLDRIKLAFDYITPFAYNREAFPYSQITDWEEPVKQLEQLRQRFNELSGE